MWNAGSAIEKKKKERDRKAVSDDFYDRINYYESRNIFSSNEPFNPSNRLYTDQAALTHPVWSTIGKNNNIYEENNEKDLAIKNKELTQSLISSINKFNTATSATPIGCKKCGYGK
jgi:hypothetical protein